MSEPLIRLLADLPVAEPDPARSERTRGRCRARLASGASASHAGLPRGGTVQIWQPLIVVLGVAYLTEVILQALRVYGVP
jgi:hypothetical protein